MSIKYRYLVFVFTFAVLSGWEVNAAAQTLLPQPNLALNGRVRSTAIDSQGRVILGGDFTTVNGANISHLARLQPDLTLDPLWNPNVFGDSSTINTVYAVLVYQGTIYICGAFSAVGGVPRNALAAIDEETGSLKAWNPGLVGANYGVDSYVNSMVVVNNTIYVGGSFIMVGGQTRNYLAGLDPVTGSATSWNPNADGPIFSMVAANDGTIYVAGDFANLGSYSTPPGVAAIDPVTGVPSTWTFSANGQTYAVALSGGEVYIGGDFTTINGNSHPNLAMVDAVSGVDSPWNLQVDSTVLKLFPIGNMIYAAGEFLSFQGQSRTGLAAFDTQSGQLSGWNATLSTANPTYLPVDVASVSSDGPLVFLGGAFDSVNSQSVTNLAALTAYTDELFHNGFECVPTVSSTC